MFSVAIVKATTCHFGKNGKVAVLFSWKCSWNQCKTDPFPLKYAQKISMKSAVFYQSFFREICPKKFLRILCEIGCFSANLTLQIPQKLEWFFCDLSEALLRLCHCQHLHECEAPLLCRHERSCCLIDKVYYKECFDFEGSKAMKTVVIIESRSFRSGFVLFPFACLHPSCGAAFPIRCEVYLGGLLIASTAGELLGKLDGKNGPLRG